MNQNKAVLREHYMDCVIWLRRDERNPLSNTKERPTYALYKDLIRFFSDNGYFVSEDKEIKKLYKTLTDYRRVGRYKDLQFRMECNQNNVKITFFQNKNVINQHGGFYDFDKWGLAPYMERLEFKKILSKLIPWLEGKGISVDLVKEYEGADRIIDARIRSCHHPQREWFNLSDLDGIRDQDDSYYGSNAIDKDGEELVNGCLRYYVGSDNYLHRGKCYHDINMNWWVLESDGHTSLQSCYELFTPKEPIRSARRAKSRTPKEVATKKDALKAASDKDLIRELKSRGLRIQKCW